MSLIIDPAKHDPIDRLIAERGAWRVLASALGALLKRPDPRLPVSLARLDDHMLRDIGLWPRPPARPPDPRSP